MAAQIRRYQFVEVTAVHGDGNNPPVTIKLCDDATSARINQFAGQSVESFGEVHVIRPSPQFVRGFRPSQFKEGESRDFVLAEIARLRSQKGVVS